MKKMTREQSLKVKGAIDELIEELEELMEDGISIRFARKKEQVLRLQKAYLRSVENELTEKDWKILEEYL